METLNKENTKKGIYLLYKDAANFEKWEVTDTFDGGFEAKDDYETKDFYFNELQSGWSLYN